MKALTQELRQWLEAHSNDGDDLLATALQYELVALIAKTSATLQMADSVVMEWAQTARHQLWVFWPGRHP